MEIRFTQSARKHRIGKAHAMNVMFAVEPVLVEATDEHDARLVWVGQDTTGRQVEIVAVILEEQQQLLVIHVMPEYRGRS